MQINFYYRPNAIDGERVAMMGMELRSEISIAMVHQRGTLQAGLEREMCGGLTASVCFFLS